MKMKNMLIGGMSLALVACISIGGTLAALTASDNGVKNTFTFVGGGEVDGAIKVTLTETIPTEAKFEEEVITLRDDENGAKGLAYTNLVPGQQLHKQPKIGYNTKVAAYVFVKIENSEDVTVDEIVSGWEQVPGHETENVYYKAVEKGNGDLGAIFNTVTVTDNYKEGELDSLVIKVGAIQQAGFADAKDAYDNGNVTFKDAK